MKRFSSIAIFLFLITSLSPGEERSHRGLQMLYLFTAGSGKIVKDQSGVNPAVDLQIEGDYAWRGNALELKGSSILKGKTSPSKLFDSVRSSGEITVEVWLERPNLQQEGPARLVTFSKNTIERNFTLGQEKSAFDFRLRSTKTGTNGTPSTSSGAKVKSGLTHIVYTREKSGKARIFVDGKEEASALIAGDFSNWNSDFQFAVGNEMTRDRPWNGLIHLVAVYSRSLPQNEVLQNFRAGPGSEGNQVIPPEKENDLSLLAPTSPGEGRNHRGLQMLYLFKNGSGKIVKDQSGVKPAVDLQIEGDYAWRGNALELKGPSILKGKTSPSKLFNSVRSSGEISVEVWVERPNLQQEGPARLVTLSKNTSERNFTLGQEKSVYDFRLRTTTTGTNGIPSLSSGGNKVKSGLSHIVSTREKSGKARFFIDGKEVASKSVPGDLSNWSRDHQFAIGNELTRDRSWNGLIHLVAVYSRSLPQKEVLQNFKAGPGATGSIPREVQLSANETLFSEHIAPLFANHCLECHDASIRKGDLDLSHKKNAFASIDANDLWEMVESDEMPHKRPPLSDKEKQLLKNWVAGGAKWSLEDPIDPANYTYYGRARQKTLRRLTVDEYIETVKSTINVDISDEARNILPKDIRADGFSNTAYNLHVDFLHVESYSRLASRIVEKTNIKEFAGRFSSRRNVNDKDMRALIESMGEWVLRGPIDRSELDIYRGVTTTVVSAGGGFDEAVSHLLEAMLQSPRFIYRIESDDGSVSGEELASRISYMIWGSSPDGELRQKAKSGELFDRQSCAGQVRRMLKDPRAMQRSLTFASEWLNLGRLQNLKPNRRHFPKWDPSLADDMRRETLAFYEEVVWKKRHPMSKLLNAQTAYLTPALAKHYGIPYWGKGGLEQHDVSRTPERGGLLTQGSILTMGGDEASMVTRGLFVLNDILRSIVKDPPPCVDTTPVPSMEGISQRDIAERRIANKSCGGCHSKFEPLAFGLEKFDGLGSFHHRDPYGNVLREDGEILFPGAAKPVSYQTSSQLMNLLAESNRVSETIAWKLTQFSIGRPLRSDDLPAMKQIISESKNNGGTYHSLIEAIALSDLIQNK